MTTVLALGCFDLFHVGHLYYLQEARKLGDVLIVAVTLDEYIDKGDGRPAFPFKERVAMIEALAIVDKVIPSRTGLEAVKEVRPNIYVKGREYEGRLPEKDLVEFYGGRVVFIDAPVYSSTEILSGKYLEVQRTRDRRRYPR